MNWQAKHICTKTCVTPCVVYSESSLHVLVEFCTMPKDGSLPYQCDFEA